jgi:hypothetical protein
MIRPVSDARSASEDLVRAYLGAKECVVRAGFAHEVDWQDDLSFDRTSETDFLREGAWVILCSGMRESVVRGRFARVSQAFGNWKSAEGIVRHEGKCRRRALSVFCHRAKVDAIIGMARRVAREGFSAVREHVHSEGVSYLRTFSYIGPTTAFHLAKNLGLDVAKPDRHLLRVCSATGFGSPENLCSAISRETGEKIAVVDLVIWRFATLRTDYLDHFGQAHIHS